MALIKSISGIRGTIGGKPGEGLTPPDIVLFTSAFCELIRNRHAEDRRPHLVVGRDSRPSGIMIKDLVTATAKGMGVDVTDLDLTTTPSLEIAVTDLNAGGGIMITGSHNPANWNALKLLNNRGEFLSSEDGELVLKIAEKDDFSYANGTGSGKYHIDQNSIERHIDKILDLPLVDIEAISNAKFHIVVDGVRSTGGMAIPLLLKKLGVKSVDELYCEPTGDFPHNPEPLPENLGELSQMVVKNKAHAGFAVDPDADRLAIVCEDGEMFGEEYTLVAVADYVMQHVKGNTVSNLSSTLALRDITLKAGGEYFASAVGEVNVVQMMKEKNAVIGGEGNGGVIYPDLHYGRDALAGVALFLTSLAKSGKSCSSLRRKYPDYFISKNKINLAPEIDTDNMFAQITEKYKNHSCNHMDGVRIDFGDEWVHLRKSNTEPVLRIYSESNSLSKADVLAQKIIDDIRQIVKRNNGNGE